MIITQATSADAQEILDLQKLAYQSEAALYQDYSIAPLIQTLSEITAEFHSRHFLKAVTEGSIRGSVRAHLEDGTCYIGRLIVHPAYQNLGLGTQLMSTIEGCFPDAQRYELFTGHLSERNLSLYRQLGYVPIRREPVPEKITLVFLEKKGKSRVSGGLLA
jgi:ribosomal protein S18 acetylase RimI-like enzyme